MKITSDFHIHTRLSLCAGPNGGTYPLYMEQFRKEGLTKVGFADHFWDDKTDPVGGWKNKDREFYDPQNFEHILPLKREIEADNAKDIQVFFGAEVEYNPEAGDIALTEATAEQLEFIIVPNSHTHKIMPREFYNPYEKHGKFMVDAFVNTVRSPLKHKILAIAHPFVAVCCPYDAELAMMTITDDTYKRIFSEAAEAGIALELNTSTYEKRIVTLPEERLREHIRMFQIGLQMGCKISFGSDAHLLHEHYTYLEVCERAAELFGIKESDLVSLPNK